MTRTTVTLCWALGTETGWGLLGKHTALNLETRYHARPRVAARDNILDLNAVENAHFEPIRQRSTRLIEKLPDSGQARVDVPGVTLAALANNLRPQFKDQRLDFHGERNVAIVFAEDSRPSAKTIARLNENYDAVVAGSSWSADILRRNGVSNLHLGVQGVDRFLFHPSGPRSLLRDSFIIFSGGKFEFRKGQDIVTAAFKRFHARHPEARLMAMWSNSWLGGHGFHQFALSPIYPWIPCMAAEGGAFDWGDFVERSGVDPRAISILGSLRHRSVAEIMRYADVAVFPNRAEAGTNLVAMQTMACGIPTILSANTGHLDIIDDGACLPLLDQTPLGEVKLKGEKADDALHDWSESSVDELDDTLERIYRDREAARKIGERGAAWMSGFGWDKHTAVIAEAAGIDPILEKP